MTSSAGNRRILSTPDRTCHLALRSMEFLAICSFLAFSTASCRITLTAHTNQLLFSGFREIKIYRNKRTAYQISCPFLERGCCIPPFNKNPQASNAILEASQTNPPQTNACLPPRNGQPRKRPEYPPGSNTEFFLNFVSLAFLQHKGTSWLEFIRRFIVLIFSVLLAFSQRLQERGWE